MNDKKNRKINKILIASVMFLMIILNNNSLKAETDIGDYTGESIQYLIRPAGISEYHNLGMVDLNGIKVNLVTLSYKVLFVNSTEKIYFDPKSFLPYKIERTIFKLWWKEYVTEEFDQKNFTVTVTTFKGQTLVNKQIIKADGPIQNVLLSLFYLRKSSDFKIGWNFTVRILDEFKPETVSTKLELVSIDQISVPAGQFQAYHFKSIPAKFELWINKNTPQVPLKIKLKSVFDCSVSMKGYSRGHN